jgi:hypothetical protein
VSPSLEKCENCGGEDIKSLLSTLIFIEYFGWNSIFVWWGNFIKSLFFIIFLIIPSPISYLGVHQIIPPQNQNYQGIEKLRTGSIQLNTQ